MKLKRSTARRPQQKRARGSLVKSTKRVSGDRVLSRKSALHKVKDKKAGEEQMISKAKKKTAHTRRATHAVAHEASAPAKGHAPRLGQHPRQNTVPHAPAPGAPGEKHAAGIHIEVQEAAHQRREVTPRRGDVSSHETSPLVSRGVLLRRRPARYPPR